MFLLGDQGKTGEILTNTTAAMYQEAQRLADSGTPLNSVAFVGDNFYPIGLNVDEGARIELVEQVMGPMARLLKQLGRTNVHAVPGNHDYYCDMFGPAPYGSCNAGNLYELSIPLWTYHLNGPASIRYPVKRGSADSIELIMINSAFFVRYDREVWGYHLDSLRTLLKESSQNKSIKWRLMFAHHPIYTFGEHGGYRIWDPRVQRIRYLGNCVDDKKDPIKYIFEFANSHEDNCAPRYRYYRDSIMTIIHNGGARIHAYIAGHEHSLQFLAQRGGLANTPKIFIITGAASKHDAVRTSFIDTRRGFQFFSHPQNTDERRGESIPGFVSMQVENNRLKFWFINSNTKERTRMGGSEFFYVDNKGLLVETK